MSADPSTDLIVRDHRHGAQAIAPVAAPMDREAALMTVIARAAADPAVDIERMERLFVMQREMAAQRAEREFVEAMAEFKTRAPKIIKDKLVGYENKDGTFTGYKHATLAAVCEAAIAGLAAVGISHRWGLEQEKDGRITVTCILTHKGGHSVPTSLSGLPDNSGKKNAIQQTASTVTYLQRYTLLAATGLATEDDDGRGGAPEPEPTPAPAGYEAWLADLQAVADEGTERLRVAFTNSSLPFRKHLTDVHGAEWARIKDRAAAVRA